MPSTSSAAKPAWSRPRRTPGPSGSRCPDRRVCRTGCATIPQSRHACSLLSPQDAPFPPAAESGLGLGDRRARASLPGTGLRQQALGLARQQLGQLKLSFLVHARLHRRDAERAQHLPLSRSGTPSPRSRAPPAPGSPNSRVRGTRRPARGSAAPNSADSAARSAPRWPAGRRRPRRPAAQPGSPGCPRPRPADGGRPAAARGS